MVQKSGMIKCFLGNTYSKQILYLNSVSESEKTVDSKIYLWFYPKFHFKFFKYKVVVYNVFLSCGNYYHSLSRAK
jgi:hypothetical protein